MRKADYAEICGCVGGFFLMLSLLGMANIFAPCKIIPFWLLVFFISLTVASGVLEYVFERAAKKQKLSIREQTIKKITRDPRVYFTW
ncbi:MAG: hypothetical protein GF365_01580 [Candidatus Buchananbacteria bacterium]|nr:hypothetical protein [Candidatus Buchananbacteria bacterium]